MIRQLKADFRYAVYSKMFIGVLLLFFLTTLLSFFMNYQNACFAYESYQRDLEFYQQAGNDIEAELNAGYTILEGDTVENPLAYHHEKLSASIYSLKPDYVIPLLCEGSLVFFPILASFFGLLWAAADLKYKTLRHRVQRSGKLASLWSRQLSGLLVLIFLFLLTIPFALGIQTWFYHQFVSNIPMDSTDFLYISKINVNYGKQLLFAAFTLTFYYEFGYTFGNLLKGNPISIVLVCLYVLFIPPLFAYDIANVMNNFARTIFEFVGAFSLTKVLDASLLWGGLELASLFAFMLFCNVILAKKRSAYV